MIATINDIPDFVIQNLQDNGLFLSGYTGILRESGEAGAYNWEQIDQVNQLNQSSQWAVAPLIHPSAYMKIEDNI